MTVNTVKLSFVCAVAMPDIAENGQIAVSSFSFLSVREPLPSAQ